ncbi:mechanosensitive channel of smallconductance-like 4 [Striga asiatica]|uniref:Mechanosensitive channel of smallconductance-like 4 n=1 Tax=Striga asiatica TaxID=4170 RepID=A0A5A7P2H1_STRAF|nr:mechanosensitive channel of smallconductance-like 4 [Striga asiatica]
MKYYDQQHFSIDQRNEKHLGGNEREVPGEVTRLGPALAPVEEALRVRGVARHAEGVYEARGQNVLAQSVRSPLADQADGREVVVAVLGAAEGVKKLPEFGTLDGGRLALLHPVEQAHHHAELCLRHVGDLLRWLSVAERANRSGQLLLICKWRNGELQPEQNRSRGKPMNQPEPQPPASVGRRDPPSINNPETRRAPCRHGHQVNQRLTEELASGAEIAPRHRTHLEEEGRRSIPPTAMAAFTVGNRNSAERSQRDPKSDRPPTAGGDPSDLESENYTSKHIHPM